MSHNGMAYIKLKSFIICTVKTMQWYTILPNKQWKWLPATENKRTELGSSHVSQ